MASNSVGFTHGDRRLDRQYRGGVLKIEQVYRDLLCQRTAP